MMVLFSVLLVLLASSPTAPVSANQQAHITIREGETPPQAQYVVSAEHNANFGSSCKAVCNGEASCLKICDSLDQNIQAGATQQQLDQVTNQLTSGIPGLTQAELNSARQQYNQQFASGGSGTPITFSQPPPPSTTTTLYGQPPPPPGSSVTSFQPPPPSPSASSFSSFFSPPPTRQQRQPKKEEIQWGVPQFPKLPPPKDPGLPDGALHITSTVPKFGQILSVDDFKQKFGRSFFGNGGGSNQPEFGQIIQQQRQQQPPQRRQQPVFSFGPPPQPQQQQFGGFQQFGGHHFHQQPQQPHQQPNFGAGFLGFGDQQQQQHNVGGGQFGGFGGQFGGGFGGGAQRQQPGGFGGAFGGGGGQPNFGGGGFGGGFRG